MNPFFDLALHQQLEREAEAAKPAAVRLDNALIDLAPLCEGNTPMAVVLDIAVGALRSGDLDGSLYAIRTFGDVMEREGLLKKFPLLLGQLLDIQNLATIVSLERSNAVP